MYEQFMSNFTYRDSASRQVELFLSFMNFQATSLLHLLYCSTYGGIKTIFLILSIHCMLGAHNIIMSPATIICECSLNQFSTSLS